MTIGLADFLPIAQVESEKTRTTSASTITNTPEESAPPGVNHYASADEMPASIQKYWHQRHDLFSRYDERIWLTDDAWFGVTPEPIAHKIATHLSTATPSTRTILIDAFAGAGGNTIAFALSARWTQIYAIERDAATLACAKHNAALYGVEKKIWWICGDAFALLRGRLKTVAQGGKAVVFGSPPWGGPGYRESEVWGVEGMVPYGLGALVEGLGGGVGGGGKGGVAKGGKGMLVLYLPRTSDLNEIARYRDRVYGEGEEGKMRVVHYCMWGASKAICVFFGSEFGNING